MIPARKRSWFESLFSWHVRRRFARRFSAVRVDGLDRLASAADQGPLLVVANHSSWWDGLVVFDLSFRTLGLDGYALMDAKNLRALPFLGWIGGFGVELGDKEDGSRVVEYGAGLLRSQGRGGRTRALWIFPQGRERPMTERPLDFKPGAARIAHAVPQAIVVPMAMRYEHGRYEKPDVLIRVGDVVPRGDDVPETTRRMEDAVTRTLDELQSELHAGRAARWPVHIDGGAGMPLGARVLAMTAGKKGR